MRLSQKGAASVLVIFMLLILVTLGALAITSANANYRLSQRSIAWNTMYYELDAQGEVFLSALDQKLIEAEKAAGDDAAAGAIYFNYVDMYVKELVSEYPGLTMHGAEGTDSDIRYIDVRLTLERDLLYGLAVSVSVEPPSEREDGAGRYRIVNWSEYQENAPAEQEIELWDGSF